MRDHFSRAAGLLFFLLHFIFHYSIYSNPTDGVPHPSSRIVGGVGQSEIGNFSEFQYRYLSHDIMNRNDGYFPFSESGKFNTTFRYYQTLNQIEITKLSLIKFASFAPFQSNNQLKSYIFDVGIESVTVRAKKNLIDTFQNERIRVSPWNVDLAAGYTYQISGQSTNKALLVSFLGGMKAQFHPYFKDFYRVGPQAIISFLYDFGTMKFQFISAYQYYILLGNQNDFSNTLRMRYSINNSNELRLDFIKYKNEQEFVLNYHFMF